eukprot:COSAG01_NODE_62427_length_284_cov_1.675676_1_plen_61_part_01
MHKAHASHPVEACDFLVSFCTTVDWKHEHNNRIVNCETKTKVNQSGMTGRTVDKCTDLSEP